MSLTAAIRPHFQRELVRRATVGLALIVLALGDIWLGGLYFWALVSLGSILMMGEWSDLVKEGYKRRLAQAAITVPLLLLAPQAPFPGPSITVLLVFVLMTGVLAIGAQSVRLSLGLFYAGLPAVALVFLRELDFGHEIAMWALSLVWATDIGAFFVGKSLGGPKIWPAISPKKTWSGGIGGILSALGCGLLFHYFGRLPLELALFSGVLSILAQAGDFFESFLKRRAGVKDSGDLLPGHGGVMDRLDGLVPVAPLVALLWLWWMM
ncbi:MAG: phosphatidate cytidylyltransferase [Novosphingopyxis baekryungensis]|uniref:phosphatidate cytidylyltransferase n=1 Tax=Novosphingopyxis baekryungensis TaxID=279369 RepID=UPI0003B3C4F9|nr:phosphatidate cytidylyltransferase [Novosphingopyxis baekryungensis]MDE0932688.1 phosphatidate cytidylyltransferase [Novosphingopyxis baekryungensis]